jgi:hypothetical protein
MKEEEGTVEWEKRSSGSAQPKSIFSTVGLPYYLRQDSNAAGHKGNWAHPQIRPFITLAGRKGFGPTASDIHDRGLYSLIPRVSD